jgi:mevalonate kinase
MQTFHSNGKLLLTGEYLVLDGALALAIPTSYGQSLIVSPADVPGIQWTSLDSEGQIWYQGEFFLDESKIQSVSSDETSKILLRILREARKINAEFLSGSEGCKVTTTLNFPLNWGLGTSSTLINNIAQWAGIDGIKLLRASFGGSGYDIAVAQHDSPILYSNRDGEVAITPVRLEWNFLDRLFFVYLNKKQDSKKGIAHYRTMTGEKDQLISKISAFTLKIIASKSLLEFTKLMEAHELAISGLLEIPTIKETLFPDYSGLVKSLGAWGGDFVLVSGDVSGMVYFANKGYKTIIPFSEMIK